MDTHPQKTKKTRIGTKIVIGIGKKIEIRKTEIGIEIGTELKTKIRTEIGTKIEIGTRTEEIGIKTRTETGTKTGIDEEDHAASHVIKTAEGKQRASLVTGKRGESLAHVPGTRIAGKSRVLDLVTGVVNHDPGIVDAVRVVAVITGGEAVVGIGIEDGVVAGSTDVPDQGVKRLKQN